MREIQRQRPDTPATVSELPGPFPALGPHSLVVPRAVAESSSLETTQSASESLVEALWALGVRRAYAVFGGGIAPFCEALSRSPIQLLHFRHETGAAFAAVEDSLASGQLTVVVATTGPGITNLYTGMAAARSEGARVLFVSGVTSAAQRGRGAFQETSASSTLAPLFDKGSVFHYAGVLEDPAELAPTVSRLASGMTRENGFVAHLGLPMSLQTARASRTSRPAPTTVERGGVLPEAVERCVEILGREPFVIWAGFGARHAARGVRQLAERTGAHVFASPRAKGVMPENHPLYLGVSGL
ncbi:MAG TPA: thiamine pyrophosphate-binding protein, partial [Polyangiaceae bacterium]|nr:thiamine pyrophosphate-binding protein [Polyangiaceae bacterium]